MKPHISVCQVRKPNTFRAGKQRLQTRVVFDSGPRKSECTASQCARARGRTRPNGKGTSLSSSLIRVLQRMHGDKPPLLITSTQSYVPLHLSRHS